jgi:competence protein ComEA
LSEEGPPDADPHPLPRPIAPEPLLDRLRDAIEARGWTVSQAAGVVGAAVVALGIAWWVTRPPAPPVDESLPVETTAAVAAAPGSSTSSAPPSTGPSELVVHAAGAVTRPGLYRVPAGARVADVIDAAGGLAPDADADRVNLAQPVGDGERIYVLRRGEGDVPPAPGGTVPTTVGSGSGGATGGTDQVVDLNTASADELDTLPGVGPATAEAIIAYRTEHGPFRSVDELLEVRGIGDAKLAELRDRVRV